jgi:Flp pilus assembly protein TadB
MLTVALVLIHLGAATGWLGAMGYSLFVVQPRLARVLAPDQAEEVYRELAAGNRWRVVGLIATLAASGAGLAAVHGGRPAGWWLAVAGKAVLLAGASGLFWWVSWRGWPRRIFALRAELPAQQARFRRLAMSMFVLVGTAFAIGVLASRLA